MKLQVTQENLNRALGTVGRVSSTRGTLPILSNVLLKTADNRLSIAGTNLDIAITHQIGAKIEENGSITVPARLMQEFVSSLPSGTLNLELEDHKLHISTERFKSTINGISAEEFPVMPAIGSGAVWKMPAAEFKKALSQVVFAASSDDARPVLCGVYFFSGTNGSVAVATDSYRLAEKKLGKNKTNPGFLVPAGAVADLLRIVADEDKEVGVVHDDQQVQFSVDDVTMVARLVEGNYPDYKKLIPTKFTTVAQLSKKEFANITKVSSLFARESAGSVTIKVDKSAGNISIKAIASQIGENVAEAKAVVVGGGEVTLNSRYLIEALNVFESDDIEFCFNGKLEPCILRSPSEPDYLHLIMPLRS